MMRRWLKAFRFWRTTPAQDVDAELRFHFEQRTNDLIARGLSAEAARTQAEAEFGDRNSIREQLVKIDERMAQRRQRAAWWDTMLLDMRHVIRGLARSPGFSAMVVVTLAIGLGANTALVSVLERLLWRLPAGVPAPNDVRRIHNHYVDRRTREPSIRSVFNYPEMRDIARIAASGPPVAGFRDEKARLGRGEAAREIATVLVVGDYFGVLGLQPALGRFFTATESRAETKEHVAVISHRLWLSEFEGAQSAIGKEIELGARRYTIIGVAPVSFHGLGLDATDAWVPLSTSGYASSPRWLESRNSMFIRLVTRVRNERDVLALEAAATNALREERADSLSTAKLASVIEPVWPDGNAPELSMATRLAGVMGFLLLIACANVANLLLARGLRRRREIAVRLALGVSRARLAMSLILESVVLALLGGIGGFVLGAFGSDALRRALLPRVTWGDPIFEFKVGAFSVVLALVTGLVAGLLPALRAIKPDLTGALKAGARDGGGQRSRLRNALIVAQAALSIVLVAAAGLFVLSLRRVENIDIGYAVNDVAFAAPVFSTGRAPLEDLAARMPALAEQVRSLPGVAAAGLAEYASFGAISFESLALPGGEPIRDLSIEGPFAYRVSHGYFDAQGMRILSGRDFATTDREGAAPVMIVNERMANALWPGERAVGKCIIVGEPGSSCREVIGVVSNANAMRYIEDPAGQFYVPLSQSGPDHGAGTVVVRAQPNQMARVLPLLRQAVSTAFPGSGPPSVRTMLSILAPQLQQRRLAVSVYGAAAIVALAIAAMGIYSSVSYAVSQRMHEMGVRAALGARASHIVGLILSEATRVVLTGAVLGVVLAVALGKAVASLLYNTSTRDPVLLATVSLTLLVVAIVACFVPAWRATRANPVEVLRGD